MKYSVSAVDVTAGVSPQTLINIFSLAGNARGKIYEMMISSNDTPDDQSQNIELWRTTANGTELSGYVPVPLDPDGPASNFDSGIAHTVEPTETALSRMFSQAINMRNSFRWVAKPGSEFILPATTSAGANLVRRTSTGVYLVNATILFEE